MTRNLTIHILLNPVAGQGRAMKAYHQLKSILDREKIKYSTQVSERPYALIPLAKAYADRQHLAEEVLIIIGGDGSLNESLNGIKQSVHPDLPLTYLPAGSGNDFARAAKISSDPQKLVKQLIKGVYAEKVDCGVYQNLQHPEQGKRYFVNNLGIGFDAFVVHQSNKQELKKRFNRLHFGHLVYGFNIIKALRHQDTFMAMIRANHHLYRYGDSYFVTTTNHPYFGGGFAILPKASIRSHQLDTVIVEKPKLSKFVKLFLKLIVNGSHVNDPHFHYVEGKEIEITTYKKELGQLDGENLARHSYHIKISLASFYLIK